MYTPQDQEWTKWNNNKTAYEKNEFKVNINAIACIKSDTMTLIWDGLHFVYLYMHAITSILIIIIANCMVCTLHRARIHNMARKNWQLFKKIYNLSSTHTGQTNRGITNGRRHIYTHVRYGEKKQTTLGQLTKLQCFLFVCLFVWI